MHHAQIFESRGERRTRARTLAGFFAAGALLSTTVILLPGWDDLNTGGIALTILAAGLGSVGLLLFAELTNNLMIHAMTVLGTALIAACQVLAQGGSPTAMYAMLYIWVILHCSMFARPAVAMHLVLTTAAHVAALVWLGETSAIGPQIALTLVTQVSTALIVVRLAARQRELAYTDPLTGLGNRRVIERILEVTLRRDSGASETATTHVAVLDLDGFKAFNDAHGHGRGDVMLTRTAATWQATLRRRGDILARTGGDEFVLMLLDCDSDEAERTVRRLLASTPADLSCSAGLARWDGRETAERLIERADGALYDAKIDGPLTIAA